MDKIVDISLFKNESFIIKTGRQEYHIIDIPAIYELELMQEQEDINIAIGKWKTLTQDKIELWKALIVKIITLNSTLEVQVITEDIKAVSPMQLLPVLLSFISWLNNKSMVIYNSLDDKVKTQVDDIARTEKKKIEEKV